MKQPIKIILVILASLLGFALLLVALIYFWPVTSKHLQTGTSEQLSYQAAIERADATAQKDKEDGTIEGCASRLLTHGHKTAKAIVMFHGVTACPHQFEALAQVFFDAGYNVYVPRTPHHGLANVRQHGLVTANELVDYANASVTITSGLGDEIGAAGLSGGGMLATWAAEYRPEVTRLLALSPFYEPASAKAPKWQLPFLNTLYGKGILKDRFIEPATPQDAAFSYHALANYNIVTQNLRTQPSGLHLKSIAAVTSGSDDQIDLDLAKKIPAKIADSNGLKLLLQDLPADWNVKHDIVSTDNKAVEKYRDRLFPLYLDFYEGKQHAL